MYATVPTILPGSVNSGLGAIVDCIDGAAAGSDGCFGQTEVEDLRPVHGQKDVRRLDVAMHDADTMRGVESIGERDPQINDERRLERSSREPLLHGLALQEFHDQEGVTVAGFSNVVQRADVRMRERGDGLGFSLEPVAELRVIGDLGGEDLDRDRAIEAGVARLVDLAHPAGTERSQDFVRTEARAGCEGQPVGVEVYGWSAAWRSAIAGRRCRRQD